METAPDREHQLREHRAPLRPTELGGGAVLVDDRDGTQHQKARVVSLHRLSASPSPLAGDQPYLSGRRPHLRDAPPASGEGRSRATSRLPNTYRGRR